MKQDSTLLFSFFERLRKELGMPLDVRQYRLLVKTIMLGEGWGGKENVFQLCQTLWLTRQQYAKDFRRLFDEEYPKYFDHEQPVEQKQATEVGDLKPPEKEADRPTTKEEKNKSNTNVSGEDNGNIPPPDKLEQSAFESTLLRFDKAEKEQGSSAKPLKVKNTFLQHKYTYAPKFLPLTDRQLERNWRKLRLASETVQGDELDMGKMVDDLAEQQRLSKLWYLPKKKTAQEVVLVIDHSQSMIPFLPLEQQLHRTLASSHNFTKINTLYFRSKPYIVSSGEQRRYLLAQNREDTKSLVIHEHWHKLHKATLVIFFSDARQMSGEEAKFYFWEMITRMQRHTPKMAWITPLPKEERWEDTIAEFLNSFIPVVEYSKNGFKQLLKSLHQLPT